MHYFNVDEIELLDLSQDKILCDIEVILLFCTTMNIIPLSVP